MSLTSLQAAGIVERDSDGGVMWTWSYPMFTDQQKQFVLKKCCLTWDHGKKQIQRIIPFVYFQQGKHWFYIFTSSVSEDTKLNSVTHYSVIISTKDFNPEKYAVLSRIFSKNYDQTGSPITLLEQYLKVVTLGSCQSNNNGIFKVKDFDEQRAYAAASLKDVVNSFGIESILLYTAVLLKKRILVYHDKVELLLELTRSLPALAWHRRDWTLLHPWIDDLEELSLLTSYIAGTCEADFKSNTELYDVYVDAPESSITVQQQAQESLALGKIHKDVAKLMVELANDDSVTNQQFIEEIDAKTNDILSKLRSLGGDDESVSIDEIKSKNLNSTTERFLISLAEAEKLLRI